MREIIKKISLDLNVPEEDIGNAIKRSYHNYKIIRIKKKSGGYREAIQPSIRLKIIQQWILFNVLQNIPVSDISTAFGKGDSILNNATMHARSTFSIRIDIKNFFNSIKADDLINIIKKSCRIDDLYKSDGFNELLVRSCFDANERLPVGYLTSPYISNAVMFDIDNKLANIVRNEKVYGKAVITRYADDFVFSTDKIGACKKFYDHLNSVLEKENSPKLCINETKTRIMSKRGGAMIITGLLINNDGLVRATKKYRDQFRLLIKLYNQGRLKENEIESLKGHISFIQNIDPILFTKIAFKYHDDIDRIMQLKIKHSQLKDGS
jgi:RNA-directed DNA polymerase